MLDSKTTIILACIGVLLGFAQLPALSEETSGVSSADSSVDASLDSSTTVDTSAPSESQRPQSEAVKPIEVAPPPSTDDQTRESANALDLNPKIRIAADAPAANVPTADATTKNNTHASLKSILKANIEQTFTLDPRLKKDLTEGNPAFRPIKLMQDNFAVGYNPAITWERPPGGPFTPSYATRNMALYLVGPVTEHLSGWFQMTPVVTQAPAFFPKFELFQGLANYGTDKNTLQIRGGQCFNWQNQGWGGADRSITQTVPGVYGAFNGFDPTANSKTISLALTGHNWTTGRVFGYWQPAAGTSSDPNISYHRGYGIGMSFEKLLCKTGITGVQTNLTIGNTPAYNGNLLVTQSAPFIWWTSWINKSFQDKRGFVRANPSFGLTVFGQKRNLDDPNVPETRSRGYGYTFDLMTIPVNSYWTSIVRFDQYRVTNLAPTNTTYTYTVGQAVDFHLPNKARLRVTFDYQLVTQRTSAPDHKLILGFWPIW